MQPLSTIRDLNPSLLKQVAPAGFQIHVPKGAAEATQAALESVPAANRNAWRLHHVDTGDTLEAIARTYHLSTDRILAVNHTSDTLDKGDVLLIPASSRPEPAVGRKLRGSRNARGQSPALSSSKSSAVRRGTHIASQHRFSSASLAHKTSLHVRSFAH